MVARASVRGPEGVASRRVFYSFPGEWPENREVGIVSFSFLLLTRALFAVVIGNDE